jgi:hemerythrin-like domain-containing protein
MESRSATGADIRIFKLVHDTLRTFADRLGKTLDAVRPSDAIQLGTVADRWAFYARQLHHHHDNEDDLVLPRLRSAQGDFADLDEQLRCQHRELVAEMSSVDDSFAMAKRRPDEESLSALCAALARFSSSLQTHLDLEDEQLLPLVQETIPADEWNELAQRMLKSIPRRDLPLVAAGLEEMVRQLPPAERPPPPPLPIRVLNALFWRRKYRRFVAPLA